MTMENAMFIRENRDIYTRKEFQDMFSVSKSIVTSVLRGETWILDGKTIDWIEKK